MPFKKAKEKETEPKKMEKKKEKKGKLEKSKKEKTPENQGEVLLEKKTNGIITNEIELLDKEIESKQQELEKLYEHIQELLNKLGTSIDGGEKSSIIEYSTQSSKAIIKAEELKETISNLRLKLINQEL